MKKKPIYKALSFFLSICLIAATITVPAFANPGDTISITQIGNQTYAAGDNVNIPINYTKSNSENQDAVTVIVTGLANTGLAYNNDNANPAITGTATAGTDSVSVEVSYEDSGNGSNKVSDTESFNITVAALTLDFDAAETLASGITGVAYSQNFTAASTNSSQQAISYTTGTGWDSAFSLNGTTISATNPTKGTHVLNVEARVGGVTKSKAVTIEVADPVITWNPSSTTLDPGVVDKAYDSVNIANGALTNGSGTVTFESNNMPAGLNLATDGTITGTPTEAVNNRTFNVTAKAANAAEVTKEFTITIAARNIVFGAINGQRAIVGTPFTLRPSASTNTGKTISYAIVVSGKANQLPTDLSFEPTTGVINGTITEQNGLAAEGEYNVTITATIDGDTANPISVDRSFTLTVDYPRVELQPITNVDNAIATKAITNINASEGIVNTTGKNVTYAMSGHPTGLNIEPSSGKISGTPAMDDLDQGAAKTYTVQVTATADGKSDSVTFDITVNPPAFVDAPSDLGSQEIMEGKAITAVDVAAAFAGTYTGGDTVAYTLEGVVGPNGGTALPKNVEFDITTSTLRGTTAQGTKGTYALTFKATAQTSGAEATATYTLTVGERKFTTSALANDILKLGAEYSKDVKSAFVYNDPDATVTYEVTSQLPADLKLDAATGVISGKITDKSLVSNTPVEITVKAKDTANQFESAAVTFELTIQGLAFTEFNVPSELTAYQVYTFSNSDISAVFEEAGVGLEFAAPDLPSGLSIDANTGEISGPVAADATGGTVTVTVTDQTYGYTASKDINFTVKTPSIAITKPEDVTVYEGYEYTQVIPEATADVPEPGHITYSVTDLPNAIMFDNGTKTIRGAADAGTAQATPYTVKIEVGDGTTTATQTFDMTVKAPAIKVETVQDDTIYAGNDVDITLNFVYEGPNTASATVTGLPEGLIYSNGKITGAATEAAVKADPYTVEVTLTDGVKTANMSFKITVNAKTEVPPTQKPEELKWDGNTEGATNMEIRFDVPFNEFTGQVYFNGALLRRDVDYTAKSGSTIITLTNSFLKGLNSGDYNIEAVFTDSIGKASVNVVAAATNTTTGTTTGTTTAANTTNNTTADNSTDVTVPDPNKPGTDVGDGQITAESTAPAAGTTTVAKSDEGDSPKTGDNNALVILIVLTILAGGATMVLYKKRKKA